MRNDPRITAHINGVFEFREGPKYQAGSLASAGRTTAIEGEHAISEELTSRSHRDHARTHRGDAPHVIYRDGIETGNDIRQGSQYPPFMRSYDFHIVGGSSSMRALQQAEAEGLVIHHTLFKLSGSQRPYGGMWKCSTD